MNRDTYTKIEHYMQDCMRDSAHDKEHIYRVLYTALDIARFEQGIDRDVLVIACLLHDIGREKQYEDPSICHAQAGGEMAYRYLVAQGFDPDLAGHVQACITTHRFRSDNPPASPEARVLFDADKLDVTGALGIARTLLYQGKVSEPLYTLDGDGRVLDGRQDLQPSFFQEYHYKLKQLYDKFLTKRGAQLAQERQQAAEAYYASLFHEAASTHEKGKALLAELIG